MSASDSDNGRLAPRVVRVRNRCLAALSTRQELPRPSADDLAAIDDRVGLNDAWARWQQTHASPPDRRRPAAGVVIRTRRWRTSVVVKAAALVLTALLGFAVGERWLPNADAQASAGSIAQAWEPVPASALATVAPKLFAANASAMPPRFELSAGDVASLILSSRPQAVAPMSSIEARSDSLLWIRARLRAGGMFELAGHLGMVRRGVAELRVTHLVVDGRTVDPTSASQRLAGDQANVAGTNHVRFNVPRFVAGLTLDGGVVAVITAPTSKGAGGRVSR
jgi:hypothetical protein